MRIAVIGVVLAAAVAAAVPNNDKVKMTPVQQRLLSILNNYCLV